LDALGPTHNFAAVPALGKWLLSGLMIFGRLEIFPILLLFSREFWRR
jgi:trk system potassium uptake protein TrkH